MSCSWTSWPNCTDGFEPSGTLVQGTDGNLYGTTLWGGTHNNGCSGGFGCGTVFKITPTGALTTLYSFCPQTNCPDGIGPNTLVQGTDGNFYGTTQQGGANCYDCGTVFKITPMGTLTTLYSFCTIQKLYSVVSVPVGVMWKTVPQPSSEQAKLAPPSTVVP